MGTHEATNQPPYQGVSMPTQANHRLSDSQAIRNASQPLNSQGMPLNSPSYSYRREESSFQKTSPAIYNHNICAKPLGTLSKNDPLFIEVAQKLIQKQGDPSRQYILQRYLEDNMRSEGEQSCFDLPAGADQDTRDSVLTGYIAYLKFMKLVEWEVARRRKTDEERRGLREKERAVRRVSDSDLVGRPVKRQKVDDDELLDGGPALLM